MHQLVQGCRIALRGPLAQDGAALILAARADQRDAAIGLRHAIAGVALQGLLQILQDPSPMLLIDTAAGEKSAMKSGRFHTLK